MWLMIFGVIALLTVLGVIYLVCQFRRFRIVQRAGEKHKLLSWLLASLIPAAIFATAFLNRFAFYIVFIHMTLIWMLCNLAAYVIRKCLHREPTRYYAGGAAMLITLIVLGVGWFFAHHVYETDYRLDTDKDLGGEPLRAAMIADSHISVTLDGEKFRQKMEEIESKNPDILFISGDFVDDDTKRQDMLEACEALGDMNLKYGIYYVYGNHDLGYYNYRDFTVEELVQALTENNVRILEDETVNVDGRFTVTGRLDHSMERMEAGELPLGDDGLYHILLDHQPTDYDAEAAAGFDLVLCGHTHGGHIFPAGQIGLIISENDALYGHEVRGNTDFILTSGISGWSLPFKTGCISEYCIIDIG